MTLMANNIMSRVVLTMYRNKAKHLEALGYLELFIIQRQRILLRKRPPLRVWF